MNPKLKKVAIISSIVLVAIGAGFGIYFIASGNKKKKQSEIEALLTIARNEGALTEEGYQHYRKIIYMANYKLPLNYQNAFNQIKPLLVKAGDALRSGYPVSALQFLNEVNAKSNTFSPELKSEYQKVKSLLNEAFKLNSTNLATQNAITSANRKSGVWWEVLLVLAVPPTLPAVGGYELYKYANRQKYQEDVDFNKKLLTQYDINTLKLFTEVYAALTGGKDYWEIQKNPK